MTGTYDPTKDLMKFRGKDYLPVAYRLLWLHDKEPNARIESQMLEHAVGEYAVFRVTVTLGPRQVWVDDPAADATGGVSPQWFSPSATGHAVESIKDFNDYLEKAETKALGRALAVLGFGTQFALADLDEGGRIADSPMPIGKPAEKARSLAADPPDEADLEAHMPSGDIRLERVQWILKNVRKAEWSTATVYNHIHELAGPTTASGSPWPNRLNDALMVLPDDALVGVGRRLKSALERQQPKP